MQTPQLWGDMRSRMSREAHVWICEGLGVKFPRATRRGAGGERPPATRLTALFLSFSFGRSVPTMFGKRFFAFVNYITSFWVYYYFMVDIVVPVNDPTELHPFTRFSVKIVT